jgi:hypothetical protein
MLCLIATWFGALIVRKNSLRYPLGRMPADPKFILYVTHSNPDIAPPSIYRHKLRWRVMVYRSMNATMAQPKNCPFRVNKMELKNIKFHPTVITTSVVYFNQKVRHYCRVYLLYTYLSSLVVLTPNGNFWVVPLLHSVKDICAGLYVIHPSCSAITVDGVRNPHLFPGCTKGVVKSHEQPCKCSASDTYISMIMIFIIAHTIEATLLQTLQGRQSGHTGISESNSESVMEGTHRSRNWRKYFSRTLVRLTTNLIQYGRD